MVQMPSVNSEVFYFPQGHAEHAGGTAGDFPEIPACVPCRVSSIKFMADPESDEVFAKIRLVPMSSSAEPELDFEDDAIGCENREKPPSFAKTLTQSDANNGGGFSVPRYCAETIFPRLDYGTDPPVQTILAKDVHGEVWKFRHIYRGTPRRHLLTTGWSTFVNRKRLVAGDSIVFLRAENGDLRVGIRRTKRGIGVGGGCPEESPWDASCGNCFSAFLRREEDENRVPRRSCKRGESAVQAAATAAARKQPFEVVYYPRGNSPEFCVKSQLVRAALRVPWRSGMRFKMAFETEDCSRISWFMGTISSAEVADPLRWPDSPWRLLQVTWDEPDLLQNVRRVSPWLVELVPDTPGIHLLSPFCSQRKKPRLPDLAAAAALINGQLSVPAAFPFSCLAETSPAAGMQGARHVSYSPPLSHLSLATLQCPSFAPVLPLRADSGPVLRECARNAGRNEEVSCVLTMGNYAHASKDKSDDLNTRRPQFLLFGQPIVAPEQQASLSPVLTEQSQWHEDPSCKESMEPNLELGHCKVFVESEDVGRTLDLSLLGSYEELHATLAEMFGLGRFEAPNHVLYQDLAGTVRRVGDEPYSDFTRTARRLTILLESSSDDNAGM